MTHYLLFIDASADPSSKNAFGAFLLKEEESLCFSVTEVESILFENSSSSKAELQILLYVLKALDNKNIRLTVFTDSNSILSLQRRRKKLEERNFKSKKGNALKQDSLYREFYGLLDQFEIEFVKVKGHSKNHQKDSFAKFFSLVDKSSRKALRIFLKEN